MEKIAFGIIVFFYYRRFGLDAKYRLAIIRELPSSSGRILDASRTPIFCTTSFPETQDGTNRCDDYLSLESSGWDNHPRRWLQMAHVNDTNS